MEADDKRPDRAVHEPARQASEESYREARAFAWNHFDLHAKHRMEMFRSYVTYIAVVYAGYGWSLQTNQPAIGVVFAVFGSIISVAFLCFDLRIRQLLQVSERYLKDEELRMSALIGNANIRLFHESEKNIKTGIPGVTLTYTKLFWGIYFLNVLVAGFFVVRQVFV